ncbi:MAG: hypothetical protein WEA10_08255 [Actinomycetota bacterium]
MRIPHAVLAVASLSLLVASCTSDDPPAVADLGQVVPAAEQAPSGLRYADRLSGPVDLEAFRGDPQGRDAMGAAGFRSAWTALFADPALLAFFTLSRPGAQPPKQAELLTVTAALFSDAAGASEALRFFEEEAGATLEHPATESTATTFRIAGRRGGEATLSLGGTADEIVVLVRSQGAISPERVTELFDETLDGAREEVG